ncbi:MAG: DMT family protein, partial [Bacteroidia bacterium]|nr:DMT family protein [Bacteroidia bacterium]
FQLRIIQEAVSLTVFVMFAVWVFKSETLRMNHLIGFGLMIAAVYFIFRK